MLLEERFPWWKTLYNAMYCSTLKKIRCVQFPWYRPLNTLLSPGVPKVIGLQNVSFKQHLITKSEANGQWTYCSLSLPKTHPPQGLCPCCCSLGMECCFYGYSHDSCYSGLCLGAPFPDYPIQKSLLFILVQLLHFLFTPYPNSLFFHITYNSWYYKSCNSYYVLINLFLINLL